MSSSEFRVPPQDLEAEQAVLGAMMLSSDAIRLVIPLCKAEDFYREAHRKLYQAIVAIDDRKVPVDIVTLTNELKRMNEFDNVGGLSALIELTERVPTAANAEYYANIVKEKSSARKLITAAGQVMADAYSEAMPIKELLDTAEKRIFDATHNRSVKGSITAREGISGVYEKIFTRGPDHGITGMATGIDYLDELTGGFQPSELVVIGARPSVGKTALAVSMALHMCSGQTKTHKKTKVGIFTIEMTNDQILTRAACSIAGVDMRKTRSGFFEESEMAALTNAVAKIFDMDFRLNDSSQINVFELKAEARRWYEKGMEILFIDYLQLINAGFHDERREREVAFVSQQLKALAKDLAIPVVVLSQLSRPQKGNEEKKPHLSDLRESGAIEQDADTVIFIHRSRTDEEDDHFLILAKQRNGPTGEFPVVFNKKCTRFENYRPKNRTQALPEATAEE